VGSEAPRHLSSRLRRATPRLSDAARRAAGRLRRRRRDDDAILTILTMRVGRDDDIVIHHHNPLVRAVPPGWSNAMKVTTWAASGWKATASRRDHGCWADSRAFRVEQPQAFRCRLVSLRWLAVAPPPQSTCTRRTTSGWRGRARARLSPFRWHGMERGHVST